MELEFTEKDLISFGKYLLGQKRRKSFQSNPSFNNDLLLEERLREVHHADIENFRHIKLESIKRGLKKKAKKKI